MSTQDGQVGLEPTWQRKAGWSDERLEVVLLHEMGHVARLDALSHLVVRLCVALLWFHPLVRVAARHARLERERACDDLVLGRGARASHYAEHLLALVRSLARASFDLSAAIPIARRSLVEQRLVAILDAAANRRGASRVSVALAVVLILATLPVAAVRLAARPVTAAATTTAVVAERGTVAARATSEAASLSDPRDSDPTTGTENRRRAAITEATRVAPAPRVDAPTGGAYGNVTPDAAPADFSGTWIPNDPEKLGALFAVGRSHFPGSGLIIAQDARTLTITRAFTAFRHDREVTTFYNLDGSETSNTGLLADDYQEVSRARWDGADLVITTTRAGSETRHVFSTRGTDLQVVETWNAANGNSGGQALLFHRKEGSADRAVSAR